MDDDEGARRAAGASARAAGARKGKSKKTPYAVRPGPLPQAAEGEPLHVTPNKNRLMQVRRFGSRKLFDKKRKEVWLEWFAATCNASLSAEKAGVHYKTVWKHFEKDAAFFEAAQRALQIGYFRLEARQLQEAHQPALPGGVQDPSSIHSAGDGFPLLPPGGEEYEVRILGEEVSEEHFNPELALQLLREHRRHLPGSEAKKKVGSVPRVASNKEIAEALAKRLKGFALRVQREGGESGQA